MWFNNLLRVSECVPITLQTVAEYCWHTLIPVAQYSSITLQTVGESVSIALLTEVHCSSITLLTVAECCSIILPVLVSKPKPSHGHKKEYGKALSI